MQFVNTDFSIEEDCRILSRRSPLTSFLQELNLKMLVFREKNTNDFTLLY